MTEQKKKILFYTFEILLVFLIIWIGSQLHFLFKPIGTFVSTLFAPVLISGFLFYVLNPLVNLLIKVRWKKFRISRGLASFIVLLLMLAVLGLALYYIVPEMAYQIEQLAKNLPHYVSQVQNYLTRTFTGKKLPDWSRNIDLQSYLNKAQSSASQLLKKTVLSMTQGFGTFVGMITSVAVTLVTVPFMLFYMMKDGPKLLPAIKKNLPEKTAERVGDLLEKMSHTISKYISGQVIECLFVGTFSAIGYALVGIRYALLIGIFAGITNIIPYLGPYIGLIPALMLAAPMGLKGIFWVIVVCIVVQQVDGNLVYPNVIGKSLDIHPLTIIVLLLVAGNLAGLLGMILGVPLYAIVKTVFQYFRDIYHIQHEDNKQS